MALIGASNSLGGLAGSNAIARLTVVISGDSSQLSAAIAKAEGSLAGFTRNANQIGNALTRNLTLPLLAIGGLAVKFAGDFQSSMARVAGLTPILDDTGQSLEELSNQIISLASDPQIVAGPTALADSLYFAGSAGLDAATAMDVVELSAKGMSIGMGDASDIAKVLIFALNNYQDVGLTAASAMDTLTAAIREGTAEPEELAIALGRLLPISKEAGIAFGEVTAAVAALSNLGVPTRVATTSLRALFSELLAPTIQATEALNLLGVSALELRQALARGPIEAFELLLQATHGNVEALHDIIPQIRGFTAFLGLTDQQMQTYRHTLEATANSHGALEKALNEISKTPMFKFQKGLQSLQIAAIELGQKLFPVFEKIAQILKDIGNLITGSEVTQSLAAWGIAFGALLGPAIKLFGVLNEVRNIQIAQHAQIAVPSFKALGAAMLTTVVAASLALNGFQAIADGSASMFTIITTGVTTVIALASAFKALQGILGAIASGTGALSNFVAGLSTIGGGTIFAIAAAITAVGLAIAYFSSQSKRMQEAANQMRDALLEGAKAGETLGVALGRIKDEELRSELQAIAKDMGILNEQAGEAFKSLRQGIGTEFVESLRELAKLPRATDALKDMVPVLVKAALKGEDLGAALKAAGFEAGTFEDEVRNAVRMTGGGQADVSGLGDRVLGLSADYTKVSQAIRTYNQDMQTQIGLQSANEAGVQRLADKYGVSFDFMQSQLDRFGLSAALMTSETERDFVDAATVVEGTTDKMSLKMQEMATAAQEAANAISEDLNSSFDIFGELPEKAAPIDQVIAKARQLRDVAIQEGADIQRLLERGVPTSLIQKLIAEGPNMVHQFATATKGQLNQLVTDYRVAMGAMDAEILTEAAHQEVKGRNMVEGFATAIRSSSNLTRQAGVQVLVSFANAIASGDVKPAGVKLARNFVLGLGTVEGLTKQQGSKATQAFVQGLISGEFVNNAGKLLANKAANGIAEAADIPKAKAKEMVRKAISGAEDETPKAKPVGRQFSNEFVQGAQAIQSEVYQAGVTTTNHYASGLKSPDAIAGVVNAVGVVTGAARDAWIESLKNSPKFFTYYLGIELTRQLGQGAEDGSKKGFDDETEAIVHKFNQAFLNKLPRFASILDKLKEIIKDKMGKAFDAGDLELVRSLEKTQKKLEDHINKLHDRFTDFRQEIRGGFSEVLDFGSSLTQAWSEYQDALAQYHDDLQQYMQEQADWLAGGMQGTGPTAPTAPEQPDFSAIVAQQVADAKRLAELLTEASAKGLNQMLLAQFAAQGTSAIPVLEELLANPELIATLNEANRDIRDVVGDTVDLLGDKYFGKAINNAYHALQVFSKSLLKLIRDLARDIGNSQLAEELQRLINKIKNINVPDSVGGGGGGSTPPPPAPPPGAGESFGMGDPSGPFNTGWANHMGWSMAQGAAQYNAGRGTYAAMGGASTATTYVHNGDIRANDPDEYYRRLVTTAQRRGRVNAGVTGLS